MTILGWEIDLKTVNDVSIILRLVLSLICGGIIGLERGRAGRPAGFRTHILVCMGSTLAILTNQYVYQEFGISDPTRIGAQVISGIGFLGVGTIIVTGRNQVKGLTTAAGLWVTACMGLAIGIGFYRAAVYTCVLFTFVTVILHKVDNYILQKSKTIDVYMEFTSSSVLLPVLEEMKSNGIRIDTIEIIKPYYNEKSGGMAAVMTLRLPGKRGNFDVMTKICEIKGVTFAEEI